MTSPDLTVMAKTLYGVLACYVDNDTRSWTVSRKRLASDLGVSEATVKRALRELQEAGVITRQRQRKEGGKEGCAVTTLCDGTRPLRAVGGGHL
jgi:DNA-binding transcriptional regulator PaaX